MTDFPKLNFTGLANQQNISDFSTQQLKIAGWRGKIILARITKWVGLTIAAIVLAGGAMLLTTGWPLTIPSLILIILAIGLGTVSWLAPKLTLKIRRDQLHLLRFALDNNARYYTSDWPARHDKILRDVLFSDNLLRQNSLLGVCNSIIAFVDGTIIWQYDYNSELPDVRRQVGVPQTAQIIRLALPKTWPHIYLKSKRNFLNMKIIINGLEKIDLEGNFPDYFDVYLESGQQITALQILTPDVMAALIDFGINYDFEIKDDNFFIFSATDGVDSLNIIKISQLFANIGALQVKLSRQLLNQEDNNA